MRRGEEEMIRMCRSIEIIVNKTTPNHLSLLPVTTIVVGPLHTSPGATALFATAGIKRKVGWRVVFVWKGYAHPPRKPPPQSISLSLHPNSLAKHVYDVSPTSPENVACSGLAEVDTVVEITPVPEAAHDCGDAALVIHLTV